MKFCRYCGRQLADDAAFCDACGTRSVVQPIADSETINSQPEDCPVQPQPSSLDSAAPSGVQEKKKRGKKTLFIVLAVALVLIAAAVAVWWLLGREPSGTSSPMSAQPYTDYALYVKDNAVYYVDLNELESQYIFSYDGAETASVSYLGSYNDELLMGDIAVSRNGKAMAYCRYSNEFIGLYYRNLENPDKETLIEKIEDKNAGYIRHVNISDDGKTVTYVKTMYLSGEVINGEYVVYQEQECAVYQFDGKENRKIISPKYDVEGIQVSADGKQIFFSVLTDPDILYYVTDPELLEQSGCYWWKKGEGVEKIGSARYQIAISPDTSTVCYIPDVTQDDAGTLYRKKFGEEPEILAKNVSYVEQQNINWLGTWYSEDLSTVYYYNGTDGLYKADAEGIVKQVDAIEYLYPKDDRSGWPEITFKEESSNDWINYGALYMDGELVDKDTSRNDIWGFFIPEYLPERQSLIYFRDAVYERNSKTRKQGATMMLYDGEKSLEVGKNVYSYQVLNGESILYWCQADNDEYTYEVYDLYYFDGKKSHLIERDAQGFLSVWKTPAYRPELD